MKEGNVECADITMMTVRCKKSSKDDDQDAILSSSCEPVDSILRNRSIWILKKPPFEGAEKAVFPL